MAKFEIKNIIWGGETPINFIGYNLISPEITVRDENGNATVTDAVYGNVKQYDHIFDGFEIPENDSAYFVTATIFVKSNVNAIPDFEQVVKIPSLNSMTGNEVDEQRNLFITNWLNELNS